MPMSRDQQMQRIQNAIASLSRDMKELELAAADLARGRPLRDPGQSSTLFPAQRKTRPALYLRTKS
jgi:hypothetical protein